MRKNGLKFRSQKSKNKFSFNTDSYDKSKRYGGWLFFKWSFTIFLAAWMFILGIIVGRYATPVNFDTNPVKKEMAKLKEAELKKDMENIKNGLSIIKKTELGFFDQLKNQTKPAPSHRISTNSVTPVIEKKSVKTKKKPVKKKEVKKVYKSKASENSSAGATDKMHNTEGIYAIQIASFVLEEDGTRMVKELSAKGYPGTYLTSENVANVGIRYRVKVGYFKTWQEAKKILDRLRNRDRFFDAFIIKRK